MSSIAIVISAHTRHATSAEATRVTSAKASHGTSAEATHGTSAETATATVSTATATPSATAACLCTRRKQRPGKQGGCQYHHRPSSSHDISFQRPEPPVIIEPVALAQIWPPGTE
jgi:hypothetical protein